jgi:hypothetical protein
MRAMKTKLSFAVFFLLINGFAHAQNFDFKHYDSTLDGDYKSNYSGYAVAIYITNKELNDEQFGEMIENEFFSKGREIDKLTKNNFWLCWKALDEWNIEEGETYMIICADNLYSDDCIMIIATITDNGESFDWWGIAISRKDLE